MARVITADLSHSFPTLPGVDLYSGRVLEYEVQGGHYLQLIRVHDGARPRLYLCLRHAVTGMFARDLVVTVGDHVMRMRASTRKEALQVKTQPGSQTLYVASQLLGVATQIDLVMPSEQRTADSRRHSRESQLGETRTKATRALSAKKPKRATRRR